MSWLVLLAGALIALICAWLVNSLVSFLSGDRPGSLVRTWWDIFSKMWGRPSSYAEPLPDFLTLKRFAVGDQIRLFQVPPNMDRSMPRERQELLERCVGKVFRVEGIDAFGALELHVLDDGSQAPDRYHHIVFIEPQYAEAVSWNG